MFNINYFKKYIEPKLINYHLKYSFYLDGDFGDINRVEIESDQKIGGIDFWRLGWLSIDIYDLIVDKQIMNILLEPKEVEEQQKALDEFLRLLLNE